MNQPPPSEQVANRRLSDCPPCSTTRMPTYCMATRTSGFGSLTLDVPCQLARGHEGPHRYEVEWVDDGPWVTS